MQIDQPAARATPSPKYIVSEEHRFVYFVLQKVACTSIKTALLPLFNVKDTRRYERTSRDGSQLIRVHKLFDNSSYQVGEEWLLPRIGGDYRGYFKFGFVRNPWDRLASCYFHKLRPGGPGLRLPDDELNVGMRPGMNFREFVEAVHAIPDELSNPHFKSQHTVFCPRGDGSVLADFVGRFENLQEDFAAVVERIGAPHLELPHRLRSPSRESRTYVDLYDDRLRKLVYERFREDIEIFGYSF